MNLKRYIVVLLSFLMIYSAYSQLKSANIISSNMILQQGCKIPIWGTDVPDEIVQITFSNQKVKVKTDKQGKWKVELQPMNASFTPQQLIIKGKRNTLIYDNILVGEVWFCSGQSNMEYKMKLFPKFAKPVKGNDLAALELKKPENNTIHVFNVIRDSSNLSKWEVANGKSLSNTSAVGYFFAKAIQEKLNVPVGIITSAIGGTRIEGWTPTEAYQNSTDFATQLLNNNGKIDGHLSATWYNSMIAPFVPYAIKGFLWYQGENNCGISDRQYDKKMKVLVDSWRKNFNVADAPFYYVLLAPHIYSDRTHKGSTGPVTAEELPIFRAQQIHAQTMIPNSEYVVVSDLVDNIKDIHPSYKWEVGSRLSRVALAKTYGFIDTIWSGPRIKDQIVKSDSIVITFNHVAKGLKLNSGTKPICFEIAGSNGIYRYAFAVIRNGNEVVVYHPDVKNPVSVRFGWHESFIPNLINSEGLPATPFCIENISGHKRITVYTIGDSTMANKQNPKKNKERGWGMVFQQWFDSTNVIVDNRAANGRSTKSFINENRWQPIVDQLQQGDYVFIEFGHNDEKIDNKELYTAPDSAYRDNLIRFVKETRAKGAFPVLLTSIVRRNFDDKGNFIDTHGKYPDVVRKLAIELNVPLIDMEKETREVVSKLGADGSKKLYMISTGKNDNTHFVEAGANLMAGLVAKGIRDNKLKLSELLVK